MNRLPRLTAAEEPTKLASVTAEITSDFSPAWWPCSAVTVIVVVTIPAGHIRQSSSPASSARLRASACTRNTARTFCTSIAAAAQTADTAASVRLRSGRRLASEREDRCQHRLLRTHPLVRRRLAPVAATATSGGSHHAATPAVCSSQVTASAAATAAATVQSSPITNPYQNFPKATSPRRLTVPARLSQETIMVHLACWGASRLACRVCRLSCLMYQAAARTYQAARAIMNRSAPGHAIPSPSTATKA